MTDPPTSIGQWRRYIRSINTDIFNIIEHALMLASKDCPYDFKIKRDRTAEVLFACKITKCLGCEQIELAVPVPNGDDEEEDEEKEKEEKEEDDEGYVPVEHLKQKMKISNNSKLVDEDDVDTENNDVDRNEGIQTMNNNNNQENDRCRDSDAGDKFVEEESELLWEVLKIKQVIDKSEETIRVN